MKRFVRNGKSVGQVANLLSRIGKLATCRHEERNPQNRQIGAKPTAPVVPITTHRRTSKTTASLPVDPTRKGGQASYPRTI